MQLLRLSQRMFFGVFCASALVATPIAWDNGTATPRAAWAQTESAYMQATSVQDAYAAANPAAVLLYSDAATLTVEETKLLQNGECTLYLPAHADVESLYIEQADKVLAESSRQRLVLPRRIFAAEKSPQLSALQARYDSALATVENTKAELAGTEARIALWQNPQKLALSDLDDINEVSHKLAKKLPALQRQATLLRKTMKEQESIAEHYAQELAKAGRNVQDAASLWAVTLRWQKSAHHVAEVSEPTQANAAENSDQAAPQKATQPVAQPGTQVAENTDSKSVTLRYSYRVYSCGWQPEYTLMATPQTERIAMHCDAKIVQASGMDWQNADITLVSLSSSSAVTPPALRPWHVSPQQNNEQIFGQNNMRLTAKRASIADADYAFAAPALGATAESMPPLPQEMQKNQYSTWYLGTRSIAAGKECLVPLAHETWQGSFVHHIRPAQNEKAFLRADIELENARILPAGTARIYVDNALVGSRHFAVQGKKVTVHCGADPLVSAKMTLLERLDALSPATTTTGTKGATVATTVAAQKTAQSTPKNAPQTLLWRWRISVHNGHARAIAVEIEDAAPQLHVQNATLTMQSNPMPTRSDTEQAFVWEENLQGGESKNILHTIRISAPKDSPVQTGRRE